MMNSGWETQRPADDEYGDYYSAYIELVGGGNIIDILLNQRTETYTLIKSLAPRQGQLRYEEGKWTVQEVIGHLIDTERIFAYRALCISRGEQKPLPGYDQDAYVENAGFNSRSLQNQADEYYDLRGATCHMMRSFTPEVALRRGTANDNPLSVRAVAFILAGHEQHHLNILKSRYGIG